MSTPEHTSRSPAYTAEEKALRRLYRDWDERDQDQRRADHHTLMWTMEALRAAGFTVEYPTQQETS